VNYLKPYKDRINNFSVLEDGWDGYGAGAPNSIVRKNTISLISKLPKQYLDMVKVDEITPSTYGTICVDWYGINCDEYLCVEIGDKESAYFFKINGKQNSVKVKIKDILDNIIPILNVIYAIEFRKIKIDNIVNGD
jgi:hypothetical protein